MANPVPPGGTIGVCPDDPGPTFPDPPGPSGSGPEQIIDVPDDVVLAMKIHDLTYEAAVEGELQFLHMLNDELKLRANQIGIPGELDNALGMLEVRIMDLSGNPMPMPPLTIRKQLAGLPQSDAPPGSSWLARFVWALIDIDEPGLIQLDRDVAAVVWPNNGNHTISYLLGQEEIAGNSTAKAICDVLAEFLGPDHCRKAQSLKR